MNVLYKTTASVIIMSNFINPLAYAAAHTQTNTKEIKTKEINRYSYAVQNILQEINQSADYLGIKWVKGGVESASKYNLSIFSVLSETSKNVIFTQGRFDYSKEIGKTLNIGFGSRQLFTVVPQLKDILGGDEIMLGANVFFDSKSANKGLFSSAHRRYSVGLELQAPKYDFYGNIYRGQSDFINNERVLSGYDFGVVANIPMIPNAKVSVSRYDFSSDVTEKTGNKFRAEYYVNAGLSFGGEYDKSDQNNSSSKLFMKVHFTNNLHHFGNNSDDKTYTANTVKVWDKRYNEVKRINEVYVEKRLKQIIEIENPTAVEWGTPFNVADLVTGVKGGAKVTYSILDGGNTEASIDEAGVISGTTQRGTVKAKISIAATNKYAATSREIDVEFIAKDIEGESVDVSGEQTLEFGTTSDTPNQSGWWKVADHGEITYEAVLGDVGGSFDGATGVISNTEAPGTVTVTVKIAGGTKYKQGVVGTYDVVFTKSKKDIEGELVTVDGEQTLEFGETSATPNQSGWWNENEHGLLEYEAAGLDVTGGGIDEATGVISDTTAPGTVTVMVVIKGGTKYTAGDIGTFTVEFIAKDIEGESVDVSGEQTLEFGTTSDTPNQSGWWKVADHGEITYEAVLGDVGGSFDGATGVISNTEAPGTVTVTVKIAGGTKYKQGVVGTYDVVFTKSKKDIEGELVTVDGEQTLEFGETSATPNQSGWWNENEHGLLEYEAAGLDVTGGGIDEATGVISDTTAPGTVTVMVVIKGGTKYTAGDIGTFDVEFIAKDAADLEHGIDNQTGVKWGSSSIAPTKPGSWAAETHGDIVFKISSHGTTGGNATIDDPATGVISGTENAGVVTVTVAIKGGTKYAAGDVGTFTVEFIAKDIEGESVDVSGEQTLEFGTTSDTPNQSGWWKVADHGEITYEAVLGDVGGSFDGATGVISNTEAPGTVTVTVKIAGGTKYKQGVVGTYDVVFTKSKKDIEGELVTVDGEQTLEFGETSATPNQSGWWNENEHGLLEYEAAGLDVTGGGIDFVTGVISDTTAPGTVTVMVVIKGGTKYTAGDIGTYTVKFIAKDASGLTYTIDNQTDVKWGTDSTAPAEPSWVGDDGYGDLKYKANLDATGGQIDEATGEISDTTDVGTVTVTAFITGGTKYAAGDVATFTVDFVKKAASGAGLHGNDEDVEWGTSSAQPLDLDEWAEETHGEITYEAADLDATGGEIDPGTGVISDTTASGTVTVTVKIDGGTKYAAGDVGTYTVKFIAKDASGLTYTIDNQTDVKWGTDSTAPAEPSWVGDDGYGDLKYKANLDATGGQIDEATGEISDTTDVGTVTVTAFITGGTKYAAGDIGTFDVEFIAKDAADLEHGIDNQAGVKWGSPSIAPSPDIPSWAEEHGEITYETADLDATGGKIDFLTGVISGTTAPGTVTVTVWILGGTKYKEGDAGTYDVVFTKKTGKTLTPGTITKTLALNNDIFAQELLAAITDAESGSTVKSVSITSGSSVVLNTDRTGVIHLAAGTTILAVTLSNDLYKDIAVEVTVTIN